MFDIVIHEDLTKSWKQMQEEDPPKASAAFESIRSSGNGEKRNFNAFVKLVQGWKRSRRVEKKKKFLGCDKLEFFAHWKSRGRGSAKCKKMEKGHNA